jgi:hypothetical protein
MDISQRQLRELSISLVHDMDNDYDEITPFISSLGKIKKEVNKVGGFRSMFNGEEKTIWKQILERIVIQDKNGGGPEVKNL